jgi:outer membrane protein TolC
MSKRFIFVGVPLALVLAGCGLRDPYSQPPSKPAVPPPAKPAPSTPDTPAATIARFATAWVNWNYATLASERHELLTLSTGGLAAELREEAARATTTRLIEVSGAYSRGRYVGTIADGSGPTVVVTYEEVAPEGGQAQAAYQVYLARTARTTNGWRITQWQPAIDG